MLERCEEPIEEKMDKDFFPVLANSYVFWIPSSFFCFYVVPVKFRALYMCFISVAWDTYMSYAAHNRAVLILKKSSVN